jgi:site-specific recombinase XerD
MRKVFVPGTPAEMYDRALRYAHDSRLPPDYPKPHPTADWPPENITLLEEYWQWLAESGYSPFVIRIIYLPMAGHVLGLALKPHPQLDLDQDLQPALDFLEAKQLSPGWNDACRNAVLKFRRFLLHRRGQIESKITPYDPAERLAEGLPDWLVQELTRYQHVQQRNWRTARLEYAIRRFWASHLKLWRFLCERCAVTELADVRRTYLQDYIDDRLKAGYAISSINGEMRSFHSFMVFLQSQGYAVPQVLLRMHTLKEPDPLPKFLTDEQVRLLRDEMERRVTAAKGAHQRRDALLTRAAFYLLWQSGLRIGEVEELRQEDLDLARRRLTVRLSKNLKDRTVYMTDTAVRTLQAYLAVRGPGPTDHVFLYRNQPVSKDLIRERIKAAGKAVGVPVYPHRLRHTAATQLLNAGCRITSIQKFLGHKELSTTMIYARVHDQTVEDDYYRAMRSVEKRLELLGQPEATTEPLDESERSQLLDLTVQLAEPELSLEVRLEIASQMRFLLMGREIVSTETPINDHGRKQWEHPPPSPVLLGVVSV